MNYYWLHPIPKKFIFVTLMCFIATTNVGSENLRLLDFIMLKYCTGNSIFV